MLFEFSPGCIAARGHEEGLVIGSQLSLCRPFAISLRLRVRLEKLSPAGAEACWKSPESEVRPAYSLSAEPPVSGLVPAASHPSSYAVGADSSGRGLGGTHLAHAPGASRSRIFVLRMIRVMQPRQPVGDDLRGRFGRSLGGLLFCKLLRFAACLSLNRRRARPPDHAAPQEAASSGCP